MCKSVCKQQAATDDDREVSGKAKDLDIYTVIDAGAVSQGANEFIYASGVSHGLAKDGLTK